jgi:putative transposase
MFLIQMIRNQFTRKINIIAYLTAENLALRQQLIVLKRNQNRAQLKERDRVFWKILSRIWPSWRDSLVIIQPATVIRWQRRAFKLYWRLKSRGGKPGRPRVDADV